MKLCLVNNVRLPTEKAHGYQIAKMAEAFTLLGAEVEVVYPRRHNPLTQSIFDFYHLKAKFKLRELGGVDFFTAGLPSWLSYHLNALQLFCRLLFLSLEEGTVVISRRPEIVWLFGWRGYATFYDAHSWPKIYSPGLKFLLKPAMGVIANSAATADAAQMYGLKKALPAPNGVDLSDFVGREEAVEEIRARHKLAGKTVIAYAGHFYNWKGVDTLMEAMKLLPASEYACLLVGNGPSAPQAHIITVGQVPHYEVAAYLLAADILVLPTAPISAEAERYTSPIKLFEYLAAGKAIIASDLPSSRAVLSEREARFFTAGDSQDLARKIRDLSEETRQRLGLAGRVLAQDYTWKKRAQKIIDFIQNA